MADARTSVQAARAAAQAGLKAKFDAFSASTKVQEAQAVLCLRRAHPVQVDPEATAQQYDYITNATWEARKEGEPEENQDGWTRRDVWTSIIRFIPKLQPEQWFQVRATVSQSLGHYERHWDSGQFDFMGDERESQESHGYAEDPSRPLTADQRGVVDNKLGSEAHDEEVFAVLFDF